MDWLKKHFGVSRRTEMYYWRTVVKNTMPLTPIMHGTRSYLEISNRTGPDAIHLHTVLWVVEGELLSSLFTTFHHTHIPYTKHGIQANNNCQPRTMFYQFNISTYLPASFYPDFGRHIHWSCFCLRWSALPNDTDRCLKLRGFHNLLRLMTTDFHFQNIV